MQKFYIIDLQYNDFKIKLNDCKIIYLNSGRVDDNRSQVLKIYELFQNFNEKKVFLKALKKKIQLKNNFFFKEFEIFNVRNDKNLEISKILNYLKISNYLKKKKLLSQINLITDNQNSVNILNNITKNNIKIEYKEKIKKNKIKFLNHSFYFFKFLLKVFLFLIISKIFNQQNLIAKNKIKKKWSLSLFPNFYKDKKENFFGDNFNKINFLFSDETHLNLSLKKALSIYLKNKNNLLNIESFITFNDLFLSAKNYMVNKLKLNKYLKDNFFINNINFKNYYQSSINTSFINRSKLLIYNNAINKFITHYNLKEFHIYMFEYNFGFYLIRKFKQNKVDVIGHQHGIFDKNLMWLDVLNFKKDKYFVPKKIISNHMSSFKLYKTKYKKNNVKFIYKKKKISQISNQIKIKIKKNSRFEILFLAGTHDIKDIYNYSLKITKVNKNITAYIKTHPKNKFNFEDKGKIKKINSIKRKSFDKIFVSSTSTIAYDLSVLNKKFETFKPDHKSC